MKEIFIDYELKNVAPRFHKAIWRKYSVKKSYSTAKEAWKFHKRENCCYEHRTDGKTIIRVNNAKVDAYGTRYNGTL